jgi:GT2 family glycosyltransferase
VNDDSKMLIITVNFRRDTCTLQFLSSASRLEGFTKCHLVVVDNNSDDGSGSQVRQAVSEFSNVELLQSPENRGYFGGAKWALDQYLAHHNAPDWVIVCNNDLVWNDTLFLSKLLAKDPHIEGILAPAVISGVTGCDANPMMAERPSRIRMLRYRLLLSNYYFAWFTQQLAPLVRKMRKAVFATGPHRDGSRRPIYAPHGCIFAFSRRFFEAGGYIDDGYFLYAEEIRVAEMCRHLGLPVIYDPEPKVWHEEGHTLGKMLTRDTYLHQKNGFRYALARYKNSYPELGTSGRLATTPATEDASDDCHLSPAAEGER